MTTPLTSTSAITLTSTTAPALPQRVLAIGAHPDDIELSCAGTLAKFGRAGSSIHMGIVCRGDRGSIGAGPDPALAQRRADEARRAAELLGAGVDFLDIGDAEVADTLETRLRFMRLLRSVRPDLIITHDPSDYHHDHIHVSRLATDCAWFATSPGHDTGQPPLDVMPAVFTMDNVAGINFEPTHLVDITETIDVKRGMLACHVSQLSRTDSGLSHLEELAETLAKLRGLQCGVAYAEGFRPALLWGRRRMEPVFP
jgi:LmbE family N-acetylglucosaminyl deacetylase